MNNLLKIQPATKYLIKLCCLLFVSVIAIVGCHPADSFDIKDPALTSIMTKHIVENSAGNRPIELYELGTGEDVIYLIASIHGDEPAGTGLVWKLIAELLTNENLLRGRKVIVQPIANPDAKAQNTRYNSQKIDINRNFPAENRINSPDFGMEPLSQPESQAIAEIIQKYQPHRIISIHQPYACIDYDGPAEELAEQMARYSNLPIKKLGALPGSLGSYAGIELNIPTITLELPASASRLSTPKLWEIYGNTLLAAIIYPHDLQN